MDIWVVDSLIFKTNKELSDHLLKFPPFVHVKLKPNDVFLDLYLKSYWVSYYIIHARLMQYDANIHSFFYSFFYIVNSHRAQSPKNLDCKNNDVPYFYEAYSLVGNTFVIKRSHK